MKVVLCGPPRSGKSCLREGLKQAVRAIPGAPYPYVITACPDGEGAWFQATVDHDPEQARQLKSDYKKSLGGFSPEFVKRITGSVANCDLPLVLVDIGGYPSVENEQICSYATHAVLLAGDTDEESWSQRLEVWHVFCKKLGLKVIAEIHSDYNGSEDFVEGIAQDEVFRGSVHHLERGEVILSRPCVVALAKYLMALTKGG